MTDGIDLLLAQHARIRTLLDLVQSTSGETRVRNFDQLRVLLAVHEAAEELVVRPLTRSRVADGERVADERIAEENGGKDLLRKLEQEGADSPAFGETFGELKLAVERHAECEESEEFPALRESLGADDAATLARALEAAEAVAPTHPHPEARSTAAVAALGPVAAVVDRVRDAVSAVLPG